ncbi:MAG: 4Fe-4S dicluster domain-containing protein [Candidatus Hodarchaeales archaeon]|jgi:carbon-monoxide dehydrogenase iron sulfur subunit
MQEGKVSREIERELIVCNPDKCDGCGLCELICSYTKERVFNPSMSRISVVRADENLNVSMACRQCDDPDCVKACKKNEALVQRDGILYCDTEKCDTCGWCIEACVYGSLLPVAVPKHVVACDLCREDRVDEKPPCVRYCPKEALNLVKVSEIEEQGEEAERIFLVRKLE